MGWTGQNFYGVKNTTKKFKEIIESDYEGRIVYSHNVGNTFYCAVKHEDIVYGLVVLCRRDSDQFMVKYQSEHVNPYNYGANAKLLAMLTPNDENDTYAIEWRKLCIIEQTKIVQKPKVGDVLVFETALNYKNIGEHTRLTKEIKYYSVVFNGQKVLVNLPSRILKNCPFQIAPQIQSEDIFIEQTLANDFFSNCDIPSGFHTLVEWIKNDIQGMDKDNNEINDGTIATAFRHFVERSIEKLDN